MDTPTDPFAMRDLLTMDELLAAANRAVAHLDVNDGRVADALTERNVRYYVTIGLVRPAVRAGGRSLWTRDHVNDLIRIRRAQASGQSLKLISQRRETQPPDTWRLANVARESRSHLEAVLREPAPPVADTPSAGWAVRLSDTLTLTGFTARPPTADELQAVRDALRDLTDH